jgi:hypothetical protein
MRFTCSLDAHQIWNHVEWARHVHPGTWVSTFFPLLASLVVMMCIHSLI